MSDVATPLADVSFDGFVSVSEAPRTGMISLRGDLSDTALREVCGAVTGAAFPASRGASLDGSHGVLWMAPDEVLLLVAPDSVPDSLDRIGTALSDRHHLAVDVTDARALISVDGLGVRDVLAKLTPADVSPGNFGPGELRRTRFAQVAAAFWMPTEDSARVICFRSVATYVFDLLCNAAAPGGEVGYYR